MSYLLGIPISIRNIRSKRDNPGLQRQHLTCSKFITSLYNTKDVTGLQLNSGNIVLVPTKLFIKNENNEEIKCILNSAGSIGLMIQQLLPCVLFSEIENKESKEINITLTGGTLVKFSPTIYYLNEVLFPILEKNMNIKASCDLIKKPFLKCFFQNKNKMIETDNKSLFNIELLNNYLSKKTDNINLRNIKIKKYDSMNEKNICIFKNKFIGEVLKKNENNQNDIKYQKPKSQLRNRINILKNQNRHKSITEMSQINYNFHRNKNETEIYKKLCENKSTNNLFIHTNINPQFNIIKKQKKITINSSYNSIINNLNLNSKIFKKLCNF
jgi:hypothetical protein